MNETYLVQYRASEHESWKDDTMRFQAPDGAVKRVEMCRASKIFRGAQFQVIQRTDVIWTPR